MLNKEIICDKCDVSGRNDEHTDHSVLEDLPVIHHIEVRGGYGSDYPADLEAFEVDLCGNCLKSELGKYGRYIK